LAGKLAARGNARGASGAAAAALQSANQPLNLTQYAMPGGGRQGRGRHWLLLLMMLLLLLMMMMLLLLLLLIMLLLLLLMMMLLLLLLLIMLLLLLMMMMMLLLSAAHPLLLQLTRRPLRNRHPRRFSESQRPGRIVVGGEQRWVHGQVYARLAAPALVRDGRTVNAERGVARVARRHA
jgi:hypothetical protein